MIKSNSIYIRNIFYMLSYAFKVLQDDYYKTFGEEPFEHIDDLMLDILTKGMNRQIKRGILKNYRTKQEELPIFKGKLQINNSLRLQMRNKKRLALEIDELSSNNYLNQLIKSTIILLSNKYDIKKDLKKSASKVLANLANIDLLDLNRLTHRHVQIDKHHQDYYMMASICKMVIDRLLFSDANGTRKLRDYTENQNLPRLFERFVLEYYRHHYKNISVSASHIPWDVTEGSQSLLPIMKSDIILKHKDKSLIIDTKFYTKSLAQNQYNQDKNTLHSHNLYQIFSYVQNLDKLNSGNVSGLLLYARTTETSAPKAHLKIKGNVIASRSIDLNKDFVMIQRQLNEIVDEYLYA